jgi:RNA polymerase sigma factor (sigma-70 family)
LANSSGAPTPDLSLSLSLSLSPSLCSHFEKDGGEAVARDKIGRPCLAACRDLVADRSAVSPLEATMSARLPRDAARVLGKLSERERLVITLRFGLDRGEPRTLEEVGDRFHLTRERIRQIETKAPTKMRHPVFNVDVHDLTGV